VLAGPAGVGKSHLVREVVRELDGRRYAVQVVLASRALTDIPFGAVAHLIPTRSSAVGWQIDPFQVVVDELITLAGELRLVLAVDDAHHLDAASAAVVSQLVRRSAAFVLATVRTGEQAPEAISSLWVEEVTQRLDVSALDDNDIGEMLTVALGGPVETTTAHRLAQLCQGNLLLLREVVIAGMDKGDLTQVHGLWCWSGTVTVTPRLTDMVMSRIGGLTSDERQSLEVVAFGEPIGLDVAVKLSALSTMESLEGKGLVVVQQDGRRTDVRLAHPLYGEVVRAECPTLRSRRLQQQLAEAVESTDALRRGDVLRTSVWRLESGTAADPDRLLNACRQAWAAHDLGLACRLGHAALDAGGGVPAALLLGEVHNWAEQYEDAEAALSSIADLPMTDEQRLRFTTARVQILAFGLHKFSEADAALDAAAPRVSDPLIRRQLASFVANHKFWSGDCREALRLSQQLLADHTEFDGIEATVLADAALSLSHSGMRIDAVAAIENARQTSISWAQDYPLIELILDTASHYANLFAGRLNEAERMASELVRRLSAGGHGRWDMAEAAGELMHAHVARFHGDLKEAMRRSQAGAASGTGPSALLRSACLGEAAHAAALSGNNIAAQNFLAQSDRHWAPRVRPMQYWVDLARPWVSAADGRMGDAVEQALRTADHAAARGFVGFEILALHDVVRLGQAQLVTQRLSTVESRTDGELALICAEHARAASTMAGTALDRVADGFEQLGMLVYAAEARAQAAEAHAVSGAARAARRATTLALALVERCPGVHTVALTTLRTPGLTTREREIAELAASGLTSTVIADQLVLSPRTVENHLHRAFAKLGITRRAQLTDFFPQTSNERP
jgi:DNA-binding CsgD family transcriptional regulator